MRAGVRAHAARAQDERDLDEARARQGRRPGRPQRRREPAQGAAWRRRQVELLEQGQDRRQEEEGVLCGGHLVRAAARRRRGRPVMSATRLETRV
ncbi:MAG: hypothetical protein CL844_03500 [Crocinitomicaceae bacterium]|nr:hypothetical protein [Crocinitomicaceae bacterium]